jgi:uncharacterized protein DUF4339/zinc ribbon protein
MTVFIYKNEQQHGPYTMEQVQGWCSSGQIQPTDLACYEGSTTWAPLSTLLVMGTYPAAAVSSGYSTNPPSWGWSWLIIGMGLGLIGILLCMTIIGIVIGLPLIIAGIAMSIYGYVKIYRRYMWNLKESVRVGVVQGMPSQGYLPQQQYWQQPRLIAPSAPVARFCSHCAAALDADANFCPSCAAPTS